MVVVFGSFLLHEERVVNLFGFGLAVSIAIDATLVRMVLVPALMAVAGRAWYMPRWLDRVLPTIGVDTPQQSLGVAGASAATGPEAEDLREHAGSAGPER